MANKRKQRIRKVTLQDVAEAAKVSKATASLALQRNSRISEATRQRVLEAVDALGYVYNQRAASLRTRRSFTIGLIVSSLANPFYPEMIRGAEAHLAGNDYRMLLGNSADDLGRQSRAFTAMLESDVDGLILAPAAGTTAETLQHAGTALLPGSANTIRARFGLRLLGHGQCSGFSPRDGIFAGTGPPAHCLHRRSG